MMEQDNTLSSEQPYAFTFSYNEHACLEKLDEDDPEEYGKEEAEADMLREAASGQWQPASLIQFSLDCCELEIQSPTDLQDYVQERFIEYEFSLESIQQMVQEPIDKLQSMIKKGNWVFVVGGFCEFDGHHNDSEIFVLLKKPDPM
jgi:hypothetical protein